MTKLLDHALERVQALSPEMQDQAAHMLLAYAADDPIVTLTPDEEADLVEAQAEMARSDFATEAEVQSVLAKYRL